MPNFKERRPVAARPAKTQVHPAPTAAQIWAASDRMTRLVIEHLALDIWQAKPPGNTRPISIIVTHMHNVRDTENARLNSVVQSGLMAGL